MTKWKVVLFLAGGVQREVYSGTDGRQAFYHFGEWHVTGALRAEMLKDGELYDCRGLNACHPQLAARAAGRMLAGR